jgi:type IV fimbrial biogenesis protein FimT
MISRRAGFTIIELMITVAIIAILATVAAPSLRDMVKNARMTSLVNDLMADLSSARAEAVKRGVRATICTSNTGTQCTPTAWQFGWILFAEAHPGGAAGIVEGQDVILKVASEINGANEVPPTSIISVGHLTNSGARYIDFRPSGVVAPGGAGSIDFLLCDSRALDTPGVSAAEAQNKGRRITVAGTGRAQSTRCTCDSGGTVCNP